jgi:hypothetical protein
MAQNLQIKNSIKNKFFRLLTVVVILFVVVVATMSYFGSKKELKAVEENALHVLSEAIYQSMTNSMISGDPKHVQTAEEYAQQIKGVDYLHIAKSKKIIQDFGLSDKYTKDPNILNVFKSKSLSSDKSNAR